MYGTYDWCEIKLKKYWIRVKNVMLRMRSMKEINHTFSWVFITFGWRTNICYTVFRSQEYAGSINKVMHQNTTNNANYLLQKNNIFAFFQTKLYALNKECLTYILYYFFFYRNEVIVYWLNTLNLILIYSDNQQD